MVSARLSRVVRSGSLSFWASSVLVVRVNFGSSRGVAFRTIPVGASDNRAMPWNRFQGYRWAADTCDRDSPFATRPKADQCCNGAARIPYHWGVTSPSSTRQPAHLSRVVNDLFEPVSELLFTLLLRRSTEGSWSRLRPF